MKAQSKMTTWVLAAACFAWVATGCGGAGDNAGAGGDGGQGGQSSSSVTSTSSSSNSSTSSSSSSTSSSSGNAAPDHGPPATETVSAGQAAKSQSYRMVFTVGQPTQNQSKMTSSSFRLQGGLIGANGSMP